MNDIEPQDLPPVPSEDHEARREHSQPEAAPGAQGPGRRLREARESKHLTRDNAARQLHLDERTITGLEEDDYTHMPAAIYVSGYLRAYARLLNLPEDEIVGAYGGSEEQPSLLPNIDLKPQARGSDTMVRLVTYVLVLGLLALLLLWWFGVGKQRTAPLPAGSSTTAPTRSSAGVTPAPGTTPDRRTPAAGSQIPASQPSMPTAVSPPAAAHPDNGAAGSAPASGAGQGSVAPPAPKAAVGAAGSSPSAQKAPPSDQSAFQLGGLPQHLRLHYTADSWTEVYDAAGRQLVYRLVRAGETLELTGRAPFDVTLGYAPGVAIAYNGKPFDTGHTNSKDVAHFVVGRPAPTPSIHPTGGGDG